MDIISLQLTFARKCLLTIFANMHACLRCRKMSTVLQLYTTTLFTFAGRTICEPRSGSQDDETANKLTVQVMQHELLRKKSSFSWGGGNTRTKPAFSQCVEINFEKKAGDACSLKRTSLRTFRVHRCLKFGMIAKNPILLCNFAVLNLGIEPCETKASVIHLCT